jgi:drug/metabolite transporter (DMT)-like permease
MLFYTYPIFVSILATLFFKETFTKIILLSICFYSLTGMVLVLGTSFANINFWGAFLDLAAALIYSFYINIANRLIRNVPSDIATAYICLFSSLAFVLVGKTSGNLNFHFSPSAWWPIMAIAFFSTTWYRIVVRSFAAWRSSVPTRAAIVSTLEPFITITVSALLFHDQTRITAMAGSLSAVERSLSGSQIQTASKTGNQRITTIKSGVIF